MNQMNGMQNQQYNMGMHLDPMMQQNMMPMGLDHQMQQNEIMQGNQNDMILNLQQQQQLQQQQIQQRQQQPILQQQAVPDNQQYEEVYKEVLEYSVELFKVISQQGGPFAQTQIENIVQGDLTNLAHSVTGMLLHMNWAEIASEKLPDRSNTIKGKILEALGVFLKMKMKTIDELIPPTCQDAIQQRINQVILKFQQRMEENFQTKSYSSTFNPSEEGGGMGGSGLAKENSLNVGGEEGLKESEGPRASVETVGSLGDSDDVESLELIEFKQNLGQFLFSLWIDIQQANIEMTTIGSILVGSILNSVKDKEQVRKMFTTPQEVLSIMACKLNDLTSQLIRLSMELYHRTTYMSIDTSRPKMASFFQYYTIDVSQSEMTSSLLSSHTTAEDPDYMYSPFSIHLVDSFAALLELLKKVEELKEKVIAVDFEGVKLCRSGALCLIQMTLSNNPTTVYVIDIHLLGQKAFDSVTTAKQTTLKSILEDPGIEKVWFDPRNDSDALYHQFNVFPKQIFDLQLAEVACRRSQGLNVSYVQGLNKVLVQCNALDAVQKQFSEHIGLLGKNLFEPSCGGDYTVFQKRPLDPKILVYSAHDARYMLELRNSLLRQIKNTQEWVPRIFQASSERAQWCLLNDYYVPNSEAPAF